MACRNPVCAPLYRHIAQEAQPQLTGRLLAAQVMGARKGKHIA
jgi:hypothetical protein